MSRVLTPRETHGNKTYYPKLIRSALMAYLFREDTVLELRDAADHILIEWVGVEDEEDAHSRLAELVGPLVSSWITLTDGEIL